MIFLLLISGNLPAQSILIDGYEKPEIRTNPETDVFFATKNNKAGWMNVLGDWVVPPIYDIDFAGTWNEGTVVVKKNDKYGVINYKNEVVIPFVYDEEPSNLEMDLIIVHKDDDSYGQSAYFSKKGVQLSKFMNPLFEFHNGFAVITSNRKKLDTYPRIDLPDSENSTTEIWTSDFVLINTNFDTILMIKNSPFLIDLGTLNQNLRSFIMYPYMAEHGDQGLSYGTYGYLNEEGEIKIEPKFNTLYAFERDDLNFVHTRDFPFNSNRSLVVNEPNSFSFIDNSGKLVIEKTIENRTILSTSHFNNFGLACIRSYQKENNSRMIHIIDTTGKIVFESDESIAYLGLSGTPFSGPENLFLPITDLKNNELHLYSPSFERLGTLPYKDSDFTYQYEFNDIGTLEKNDQLYVIQQKSAKKRDSPMNQKRAISSSGNPLTNWVSSANLLSYKYGVFSLSDSINKKTTIYNFSEEELFSCTSCYYMNTRIENFGVFKVSIKGEHEKIINFKGTILSDSFSSMDEDIVSLQDQIEQYNSHGSIQLNLNKSELIEVFSQSIMFDRIGR